jgi:hypothetical protein
MRRPRPSSLLRDGVETLVALALARGRHDNGTAILARYEM